MIHIFPISNVNVAIALAMCTVAVTTLPLNLSSIFKQKKRNERKEYVFWGVHGLKICICSDNDDFDSGGDDNFMAHDDSAATYGKFEDNDNHDDVNS